MILAVLAASTIGLALVIFIALVDAVIAVVCGVNPPKRRWAEVVCEGIVGHVTKGVTNLIYDQLVLVDLYANDRIEIGFNAPTLVQTPGNQAGFVVGNQIEISGTATITLSVNATSSGFGFFSGLAALGLNGGELIKDSNFSYALEEVETDHHESLSSPGDLDWTDNTQGFEFARTLELSGAGMNVSYTNVLNESFNVPAIECWGFVVQVCSSENQFEDTFHHDLGEGFTFDVLPNSIAGFTRLAETSDGSYRLFWDFRFPTLMDADGDGLLSKASNGSDPNDSEWDTDGDGLSDFWEKDNASDPENPDTDGDGLGDYWEVFYGTNLQLPDTDGDGLLDGEEFFHSGTPSAYEMDDSTWEGGWTVVYEYDENGQPRQTGVSADPLFYDADDDTIIDNLERIYGYNPNVPSELNVLSLDTSISADAVLPGGAVEFTAKTTNELDNRAVTGLLQAELPLDVVQSTQVIDTLYPGRSQEIAGSVSTAGVVEGEADLVLRAGAVVDESTVDQVLVLNFDDPEGSFRFEDASSAQLDFFCLGVSCPTANSEFLDFDGGDFIFGPQQNRQ